MYCVNCVAYGSGLQPARGAGSPQCGVYKHAYASGAAARRRGRMLNSAHPHTRFTSLYGGPLCITSIKLNRMAVTVVALTENCIL